MVTAGIDEMISPALAARILGITPERVRQLADNGTLPVTMTVLGRLFRVADVEALRDQREQEGSST